MRYNVHVVVILIETLFKKEEIKVDHIQIYL